MTEDLQRKLSEYGIKVNTRMPDLENTLNIGRLAKIFQTRLQPSQGVRPGRPTNESWVHRRRVPMSDETLRNLAILAERVSTTERKVTAMQVAALLLEELVADKRRTGVKHVTCISKQRNDLGHQKWHEHSFEILTYPKSRFSWRSATGEMVSSDHLEAMNVLTTGRCVDSLLAGSADVKELCITFSGERLIEQPFVCELAKELNKAIPVRDADIIERGRFDELGYCCICVGSSREENIVRAVAREFGLEVFASLERMRSEIYGENQVRLRSPLDNVKHGIPLVRLAFDISHRTEAQPYELFEQSGLQFAILSACSSRNRSEFYIRLCDGDRIISDPAEFASARNSFMASLRASKDVLLAQTIQKLDDDLPKRLPSKVFGSEYPFDQIQCMINPEGNVECKGRSLIAMPI